MEKPNRRRFVQTVAASVNTLANLSPTSLLNLSDAAKTVATLSGANITVAAEQFLTAADLVQTAPDEIISSPGEAIMFGAKVPSLSGDLSTQIKTALPPIIQRYFNLFSSALRGASILKKAAENPNNPFGKFMVGTTKRDEEWIRTFCQEMHQNGRAGQALQEIIREYEGELNQRGITALQRKCLMQEYRRELSWMLPEPDKMSAFEKSLSERLIRVEVAHEKKLGAILPREDIANFDDAVEHIASFPLPHPAEVAPDRWELDDAVDLISHQPQQAVQTLAQNLRICLRKDVKQELLENGIDPKEVDEIIKTGMQKVDQCTHEFSEAQRKPKAKPKPIIDEDADQWKQAAMMDEKTGESASWVDREENRSPTSIGNDIY